MSRSTTHIAENIQKAQTQIRTALPRHCRNRRMMASVLKNFFWQLPTSSFKWMRTAIQVTCAAFKNFRQNLLTHILSELFCKINIIIIHYNGGWDQVHPGEALNLNLILKHPVHQSSLVSKCLNSPMQSVGRSRWFFSSYLNEPRPQIIICHKRQERRDQYPSSMW